MTKTLVRHHAGVLPRHGIACNSAAVRRAAEELLSCYEELAGSGSHLLDGLLQGAQPLQWLHYPAEDVTDHASGYQYFYHSHQESGRHALAEHGHFHVFARLDRQQHVIDRESEQAFLQKLRSQPVEASTANLLSIALDAKGVPRRLFAINRWVSGDHLLSAPSTLRLLEGFRIGDAGPPLLNRWLSAMLRLFAAETGKLLRQRDDSLQRLAASKNNVLEDRRHETLASIAIDVDARIAELRI